jgi:hypothetical protein
VDAALRAAAREAVSGRLWTVSVKFEGHDAVSELLTAPEAAVILGRNHLAADS